MNNLKVNAIALSMIYISSMISPINLYSINNTELDDQLLDSILYLKTDKSIHLLYQGANPNALDKYGSTPLHLATSWNLVSLVKVLLQHKAHVNHYNKQNLTALDIAAYWGYNSVIKLLLSHGACIDSIYKSSSFMIRRWYNQDNNALFLDNIAVIDHLAVAQDYSKIIEILFLNDASTQQFTIKRLMHILENNKSAFIKNILLNDKPALSIYALKYHDALWSDFDKEDAILAQYLSYYKNNHLNNSSCKSILLNICNSTLPAQIHLEYKAYQIAKSYDYKNTGALIRRWALIAHLFKFTDIGSIIACF